MNLKCKKCGEIKDEAFFYPRNRSRCKACKVRESVEYKQRKNPNGRRYKPRDPNKPKLQEQEIISDKKFKNQILELLFPDGIIPQKFKRRYL